MKYIFLSFLLFGMTSCTSPASEKPITQTSTSSDLNIGGVQISSSGLSVSSDTGNISVGVNGDIIMTDTSGSISMGSEDINLTNGDQTMTMSGGVVSVGTGIKIPVGGSSDMDPDVESITKDIDKIFEDIGKEGK